MGKSRNFKIYFAAVVALITFFVYCAALQNDFVQLDDDSYVFDNPHIRALNGKFFWWAFFSFYSSNWHPLTWISHALDYAVWGLNPAGHHLTNIMLHGINTFLVVLLIFRLIDAFKNSMGRNDLFPFLDEKGILIVAGTAGLLFGLHPLHVESVAWISERKDLLCALFYLLSIIMYIKFIVGAGKKVNQQSLFARLFKKYYLFSFCFFILALLSKPMAVSLPVVLLIVDWYPMSRVGSLKTSRVILYEKLPFILLGLASSVVTIFAQHAGGSLSSIKAIPLGTRLLVAGRSLIVYLIKIVYPHNLVPFYPYPYILEVSLSHVEYFAPILILIGITAACIFMMKKQKLWLSAWSYYVVTLAPVIGIMQVGGQSMADRYLYLPSFGPFLIAGVLIAWLYAWLSKAVKWSTVIKITSIVVACIAIAFMSYLTVRQIGIWKNSFIILNYILEKEPGRDPRVYFHRGRAYEKIGKFDNAIEDYNRAIDLNLSYYPAYFMRGMAFEKTGRLNDAIEDYSRAIALNPSYYEAYNNRGMLYKKLGQRDKAIEDLVKAIALNPSFDENAYFNLGYTYAEAGLYDSAILKFDQVITIDPAYTDAYANRAIVYAIIGQRERALDDFNKVIELKPGEAVNYFNRGNFYMTTGRKELAIADFQKACSLGDQISCRALH